MQVVVVQKQPDVCVHAFTFVSVFYYDHIYLVKHTVSLLTVTVVCKNKEKLKPQNYFENHAFVE